MFILYGFIAVALFLFFTHTMARLSFRTNFYTFVFLTIVTIAVPNILTFTLAIWVIWPLITSSYAHPTRAY